MFFILIAGNFQTIILAKPQSISSTVTINNKSPLDIYAATYYGRFFSTAPAKRDGIVVKVPQGKSITIPAPKMHLDTSSRLLLFSVNEKDLAATITNEQLKLYKTLNIGTSIGSTFYVSLEKGHLQGWSAIDWNLIRPVTLPLKSITKAAVETLWLKNVRKMFEIEPYSSLPAQVRLSTDISKDEKRIIELRIPKIKEALEELLDRNLTNDQVPRIAIACSGGGYRAMISTLGFLNGAQKIGLFNAIAYISSLSGSTWLLSPWYLQHADFEEFKDELIEKVRHPIFLKSLQNDKASFTKYLVRKYAFLQGISVIDLYGSILTSNLLRSNGPNKDLYNIFLDNQIKYIEQGERPYPIYTAIVTKKPYEWVEFTPYEIGSDYLGGYIPSWSLGRRFLGSVAEPFMVDGKQVFAPPLPLGYMMGIWGSAISVNLREAWKEFLKDFVPDAFQKIIKDTLEESTIGGERFFPAQVYNFTYGMHNLPRGQEKRLTLVDGGINFNLPIPPLLRKDRKIDIIIVFDASQATNIGTELEKTEKYFAEKNIRFPKIDYSKLSTKICNVFFDESNPEVPAIIYMPLIANPEYRFNIDPKDCIKNFCSTYNFEYTPEQFKLLSGLAEFNMTSSKDDIVRAINDVIDFKINKKNT